MPMSSGTEKCPAALIYLTDVFRFLIVNQATDFFFIFHIFFS